MRPFQFRTIDVAEPMQVPENYWLRLKNRIGIGLWEGIALYCGIDPSVIKYEMQQKTRQQRQRQRMSRLKTIRIRELGGYTVIEDTHHRPPPELYAQYREVLVIAAEHLQFEAGLTSPSPREMGTSRKVKIADLVTFIKEMGWPETKGLSNLSELSTLPSQIVANFDLLHEKGKDWSDRQTIHLHRKFKKMKQDKVSGAADILAEEYGICAAYIRMKAKEGEMLLTQSITPSGWPPQPASQRKRKQ
jgi:hypothetical protein